MVFYLLYLIIGAISILCEKSGHPLIPCDSLDRELLSCAGERNSCGCKALYRTVFDG
jgi:hypothetical protein